MSQSRSARWFSRSGLLNYAVAALVVTAAVVAGLLLSSHSEITPYILLFICAILLSSRIGGMGPGLLATSLCIVAAVYLFVSTERVFAPGPQDFLRLALFASVALVIVWSSAAQQRTAESLRRARDDLQETVRELEHANAALRAENAERLRAEENRGKAERELQLTIDTIPVIAARYRSDGSLDFVNQTWRTYTGLSQDSFRGHRWGMAIHPDDLPLVEAAWRAHLPIGEPFEMEHRLRRADGEYRWHFVRRVPYRDDKGEVTRWYGIAYDVEDQKRAERALQRSETYLAEAQRLSKTGSFGWRFSTGEIFWSKETYSIMGFDEGIKPAIERILERTHPDDLNIVKEQINRIATGGPREQDYEHRLLMLDGSIKYLRVRAHRQVYKTGEAELVGAVMDVTATRQAQDALQLAQAELAHVTRVTTLGEMGASIAHEVNQPLTAIATNAESSLRWLNRQVPDIEEARIGLGQIVKDAHRAAQVLRRIREFSKKADPEMIELDVNEVVREAVTLVRHEALRHGAAMRLELASKLFTVRGDRIQLQQVMINLLVNGMQAMAPIRDRDRVLIVRTERYQSDRVLVAIEDVGIGIDPENAGRLFAAFYTTKPNGLGMGLSICRAIIEAHGGRVWASPNAGPGMTFQFTLSALEA